MPKFLKFKVDLDTFIADLSAKLEENNKQIDALLSIENKTYFNFVTPLEMMDEYLNHFFTPLSHLNSVSNTEETKRFIHKHFQSSQSTQPNSHKT